MSFFGAFPNLQPKKSSLPDRPPTRIDSTVESHWSKEKMQMYTLPGETLRAGDVERYIKSNEVFDTELEERARSYLKKLDRSMRAETVYVKDEDIDEALALISELDPSQHEKLYTELAESFRVTLALKSAYAFVPLIHDFPEKYRAELVLAALKNKDEATRWRVSAEIRYLPEKEREKVLVVAKDDEDPLVKQRAQSKPALMEVRTDDEGIHARPLAASYSSGETRKSDDELRALAEDTPLYAHHDQDFVRASFDKGGSETTLLDTVPGDEHDPLRGRVIIRHITIPAYRTRKRAYEADALWKKYGLDYVPVEPIVSVSLPEKGKPRADVFTRVLGVNVEAWLIESRGMYKEHIIDTINRIRDGLIEMKMQHGHPHTRNFCLYFPKDKKGRPDINKPPRVYLIDFDQASSPSS